METHRYSVVKELYIATKFNKGRRLSCLETILKHIGRQAGGRIQAGENLTAAFRPPRSN
jgi:hypothetical protein